MNLLVQVKVIKIMSSLMMGTRISVFLNKRFRITTSKFLIEICGSKMPTRYKRGFYCRSYCLLNMFWAPLCPCTMYPANWTHKPQLHTRPAT